MLSLSFPDWNFLGLDASNKSGGLITSWKKDSLQLTNSCAMSFFLGTNFFSPSHNLSFLFINTYGPYSDRKEFWNKNFLSPLLSSGNIILGGI
jgi:hypothetical protein